MCSRVSCRYSRFLFLVILLTLFCGDYTLGRLLPKGMKCAKSVDATLTDQEPCDTTVETLSGATTVAQYWKQPPTDEFLNMRFQMPLDHGGRLEGFWIAWYLSGSTGDPDPEVYVWASDGTFPSDSNPPFQALASFHVDNADIAWFPACTHFEAYPHNIIFDPGELFHIGGSHAHEAGDTLAWLSDDGGTASDRASAWDGSAWESCEPYQFLIDAFICPLEWLPTFTMKGVPSTGYATPGDPPANLFRVHVTSIVGYNLPVTLSLLSVTPEENITATFEPNGLPCPYTSDVTVSIGAHVPYGNYVLTFQGVGEDQQAKTCAVTLIAQRPYDETMVHFYHGSQRTSNFGAIGNDEAGENFVWHQDNHLYDGTVISAVPGYPQEEHMAWDVYGCSCFRFMPTGQLTKTYEPWCAGSSYEEWYGEVAYSNFFTKPSGIPGEHDSLFVIGLKDVESTDFSIKIKIYYNPGTDSVMQLWGGVFEDWEAGEYDHNWGDMDTLHNLMYIYDPADPSSVFGIMRIPFDDALMHSMVFVHNPTEVYSSGDSCFLHCCDPGPAYLYRLMTRPGYRYPDYWTSDPSDFSTLIVGQPFSLNPGEQHIEIWIDFGRNLNDGMTWEQWYKKILRYVGFYRGDVNASDTLELPNLDISDLVCLINYLYRGGPAPLPFADQGNVDGRGSFGGPVDTVCPKNNVDVQDLVYLLNYIYRGGPAPVDYVRFIPSFWSRPSLFTNPNWQ